MWLLQRPRHKSKILEAPVMPAVRRYRLHPCQLDNVEAFGETILALLVRNAVGVVGARKGAAADAEDKPAAADLVDRRGLLSQPQRMTQRQNLDRRTNPDPLRARSDSAG